MAEIGHQLAQDRATRDAAKRVVQADLGYVKGDVQQRSLKQRAIDEAKTTSATFADRSIAYARDNPLIVSGGFVALIVLFFRRPILDILIALLLDSSDDDDPDDNEPDNNAYDQSIRGGSRRTRSSGE